MDLKTEITRRDINQHDAFLFALFAGMVDLGLVNQGVANELAKKVAAYMINYYTARDVEFSLGTESLEKNVAFLFDYFNGDLNLVKEYTIERTDTGVRLTITNHLYRICPRGLGGAELKGPLCLVPYFFMHLMNYFLARENQLTLPRDAAPIKKEGTSCVVSYELAR